MNHLLQFYRVKTDVKTWSPRREKTVDLVEKKNNFFPQLWRIGKWTTVSQPLLDEWANWNWSKNSDANDYGDYDNDWKGRGGGKGPASKAKHWTVECSGLDFHVQVGWYKAGISYLAEGQGQILLSNPTASLLTDFTVKKKPDVIRMLTEIRLGSVCRRARLVLF